MIYGLLWTGLSTLSLGPLEFIPHSHTKLFALCGFLIRAAQGLGTSATLQGSWTILSDGYTEHRGVVMVRLHILLLELLIIIKY